MKTSTREGTAFRTRGNFLVAAPPGLAHMSTYVLAEQEDWFEDEIAFLRRLLRPGMRVLDIGANYGLYALSAARAVGPEGAVWAYEPACTAARLLRRSIVLNHFSHLHLIEAALSAEAGCGRLAINAHAELNRLDARAEGTFETVKVTTLDQEAAAQRWGEIDFVKIDVEGEEANILLGGGRFLAEQSPLIMCELKHGQVVNRSLIAAFERYGWGLYRLPCAHGFLVPFDPALPGDAFELNFFACKPDRAAWLARGGFLAERVESPCPPPEGIGTELLRRQAFAKAPAPDLASNVLALDPAYRRALDAYAAWRDEARNPAERHAALLLALAILEELLPRAASLPRLSTYARVAWEAGRREAAVSALSALLERAGRGQIHLAEPFWPAARRFDGIAPGGNVIEWFAAAAIEQFERLREFSSYFAGFDSLKLLDWLHGTRSATAEMERRRLLMHWRRGRREPVPQLLLERRPDHLNPRLWRRGGAVAAELSDRG